MHSAKYLTAQEAARVYDWIGYLQDAQSLYESRPLEMMTAHADFAPAHAVVEFGCGTGAFAKRLLRRELKADAIYVGLDVSPGMIRKARKRLKRWVGRAEVRQTSGSAELELGDQMFDRFVSNYVFELLEPEYARAVLAEAHRVLMPEGKLCLVSLACGKSGTAKMVSDLWERVWRFRPRWVGGCRPTELTGLIASEQWETEYQDEFVAMGITSEIVVSKRI
jgi:ubiquinone/menaquinone biosynthesis C-methylase UbiE